MVLAFVFKIDVGKWFLKRKFYIGIYIIIYYYLYILLWNDNQIAKILL